MLFTDHIGRPVEVEKPKTVVSLVPSITELLIDLGVDVIGRTKFCVHPKATVDNIPIIGGTKNFHFNKISKLNPDLIIGNKEENYEKGINFLEESFATWISEIVTISDALRLVEDLGAIFNKQNLSHVLKEKLEQKYAQLKGTCSGSVLYLIWNDPFISAGKETYIDSFLDLLGYKNVINDARYPSITSDEIRDLKPEKILLSSEPYPFKEKDLNFFEKNFPGIDVKLVDGELYSWYGTRILNL